jgi:DNA-binding NarL/FixJ family response regulator
MPCGVRVPGRKAGKARVAAVRISVLLAEEHRVLRDGLHHILDGQRDIRVVGAVGDGAEAVREAARQSPRVVVMGILIPGLDGIEATRLIVQRSAATGVVLLSPHSSHAIVRRALDAGALGYVTKDRPALEVVKAVRVVAAGKRYLSHGLAERFLDSYRAGQHGERTMETLTAAERNILKLVVDGKSNPEIASMIGLSRRTVETYRIRLMRKLGIDSLAGLVKYAIRHGIATLD